MNYPTLGSYPGGALMKMKVFEAQAAAEEKIAQGNARRLLGL